MTRAGSSHARLLVVLALVLGAVFVMRTVSAHRHHARSAMAAEVAASVVWLLNHHDGDGLMAMLAADHRQGDASALLAARDRIGPVANYSESGAVELAINGVVSERHIYTLEAARGSGQLELLLLRSGERWDLISIKLDDAEIPPHQAPPQGAPSSGAHSSISL